MAVLYTSCRRVVLLIRNCAYAVKQVENLTVKEAAPEAAPKPKIPEPIPEDETFEEKDRAAIEKLLSEMDDTRYMRILRIMVPADAAQFKTFTMHDAALSWSEAG